MKFLILTTLISVSFTTFAKKGADLLLKNENDKGLSHSLVHQRKALILDNPFLVQVYGSIRSMGIKDTLSQNFYDDLLHKDYLQAFKKMNNVKSEGVEQLNLFHASRLYLLWQLKLSQSFVNNWLKESNRHAFLNTELAIALDEVIAKNASQWLLDEAIVLTGNHIDMIDKIASYESNFNFSIQAYRNMRRGEKSFKWIGLLMPGDPLRFHLANSAILHFARQGKMTEAAKLIKEIIEPVIQHSNNTEDISSYYIQLARLLYQARAYKAAKQYYMSVPDESEQFLQARTEALWVSMRFQDFSTILGELKSLELEAFENRFLPEVYLVNAMVNLQQCQFTAVEKSFQKFVKVNRAFASHIEQNLDSDNPSQVNPRDFHANLMKKALKLLIQEQKQLLELSSNLEKSPFITSELVSLKSNSSSTQTQLTNHLKQSWKNRQKILEATIRRMRFVKVEFLSTMRRLRGQLALMKNKDTVSRQSAALDKADKLEFRFDNVLFADELFHITSAVKNLCLKGKKHVK